MAKSPVSIPFTTDGVELALKDGVATTANSRGFITVGVDGSGDAQFILVDTTGRQVFVGAGVAGTPAGGVVSVQGVAGGTDLPISGTVTANQGNQGSHAQRWMIGLSDGSTFISPALDRTTAGAPFSFRLSDGTAFYDGTKTGQLPATLVGSRLDVNTGAWLGSTAPTVGQKTMASSVPVTIASDQSPVPVTVGPSNALVGLAIGRVILGGGSSETLQVVRATTYNEQTTNAQRSLSSSSANDTSAGTGARQVEITYYDQTCAGPFTETVTLSGTTPVATTNTDICFIEKIKVVSSGSGERNAGTITLYVNNSGGGGTIGTVGVGNVISGQGDNRTFWGHHYVQAGKTVSLSTFVCSATVAGAVATATFILRQKDPTVATSPDVQVSEFLTQSAVTVRQLGIPLKAVGPARLTAYGIPAGNNQTLNASFDFSEL
jgi:hypothetical protein